MESFIEALKNLGGGRLAVMLATFFGLIAFFIFIAARSSSPGMTLLYGDLSVNDSTEIAAKLDTVNIPYQLGPDGKQILVPQRSVGKARILLAQEGLPHRGSVGYEIFDQKQSFGTTSFQQNINALRALEGELAQTIGSIEQIRSARVHLVLPQRELFSREERAASASVFINLRGAAGIGQEQIRAIQQLVSAAVPHLKVGNVAVIDQAGNLLAKGEDGSDAAGISASTGDEMRQKYELRLSRAIEEMVGRVVGYGRVRATVTADINFDVVSRNSESYNPDGQVVRSTQSTTEKSSESGGAPGGSVTVENNLPGIPGGASAGGAAGSQNNRTEETTNYEISKTVESLVSESGQVQKLSIAVLVDGKYETDAKAEKPKDMKDEDWTPPKTYVARTQEELDKITGLVKTSVGFDENRGDMVSVVNMPFTGGEAPDAEMKDETKIMGFAKSDLLGIAETLSLSIVAVLVILLVLRPLATHVASAPRRAEIGTTSQEETALLTGGGQAQLSGPAGAAPQEENELDSMIDMSSVEGKVKASSVQKISELVTSHPNETVSVIRQWMSTET